MLEELDSYTTVELSPHQFRGDRHVSWAPRRLPSVPGSPLALETRVLDPLALAPWRPPSVLGQSLFYFRKKKKKTGRDASSCSELCLTKSDPKSLKAGTGVQRISSISVYQIIN